MKASLNSLHHQTADWLREMDFYKQELGILERRLGEVAANNTSKEVSAQVEHFQNVFIITKEQLDILSHDLREEESVIEAKVKQSPEHTNEKYTPAFDKMHERVKIFTSGFADMRFAFNTFLSKTM
jgi:hypothetical protein